MLLFLKTWQNKKQNSNKSRCFHERDKMEKHLITHLW
uniref:Uncharacterized protein n=1 Tax=Tetranychus urticae TaxID=32264 RepID=T1JRX5_TETUR